MQYNHPKVSQVEIAKKGLESQLARIWRTHPQNVTVDLWGWGWWGMRVAGVGVSGKDRGQQFYPDSAALLFACERYLLAWLSGEDLNSTIVFLEEVCKRKRARR